MERVLITGGAGFIGRHLTRRLLDQGHAVRVIDSLLPQVHGSQGHKPTDLGPEVDLRIADLRNTAAVVEALRGVDVVVHLAAAVGVGQSMYRVADYVGGNELGTASLWEAILASRVDHPLRRCVVASTMGIYGEGVYRSAVDEPPRTVPPRQLGQLVAGDWEHRDAAGRQLVPVPLTEASPVQPRSVYALSKFQQEQLSRMLGDAYGIPVTTLRLFNVYGPGQALANPYAGVLAIFGARLLNGLPPELFEDGQQLRDFVHVADVARAFHLAIDQTGDASTTLNIASGSAIPLMDLAKRLAGQLGRPDLTPVVTGRYRSGDTRHSLADISAAQKVLGYHPEVDLHAGLSQFVQWLGQQPLPRASSNATAELAVHGLMHGDSRTSPP